MPICRFRQISQDVSDKIETSRNQKEAAVLRYTRRHSMHGLSVLMMFLILAGCIAQPVTPSADMPLYQEQTYTQLEQCFSAQTGLIRPARQSQVTAAWLPYLLYDTLFASADAETCRTAVREYLTNAKKIGINTIFAHACAFGEAYYLSDLLPPAKSCSYDCFQILSDECRSLDLSLHAWINPLRLPTVEQTAKWSGDTLAVRWYRDRSQREKYMILWENRWYFNPAQEQVRDLICRVAAELLNRYPIDGIHIDDYFYPTTAAAFDAQDFTDSHAEDLAQWRREQVTALVHQLYATVHNIAEDAVFSISPQADIAHNTDALYADVTAWAAEDTACDWLIPQIYYGFEHETMPFLEVMAQWTALPRSFSVALMIGIATYKVGETDLNAGSGQKEWLDCPALPAREAAAALRDENVTGIAFYHLGTTILLSQSEVQALHEILL